MSNAKWFQKLFYKESILAIKSSLNFLSYESFKNDLILQLPQESHKSKTRIANNILHRFYPDKKVFIPIAQIWDIYMDEILLQEIFRYDFLINEPIIANFLTDFIQQQEFNSKIQTDAFSKYIKASYGETNQNLTWWLQSALRDLGFIEKSQNDWVIKPLRIPETALILLLHRILMPYPREIEFNKIKSNLFWKYIGIKDEKVLLYILEKSRLLNLIDFEGCIIKSVHSFNNILTIKPKLEV